MHKQLRNHLSAFFILVFASLLSIALTGCTPKAAELTPGNGIAIGTLNTPNVSTNTVLTWASEAATAVYTYDYVNYEKNLQNASQYFTKEGWQAYMATLTASGNLIRVIKNQNAVSAVAAGTPIILSQGEIAGRYTWKVQMPLLVTYQSANEQTNEHLIVTMMIVRTSTVEGVRGLGIKQFIALKTPQ